MKTFYVFARSHKLIRYATLQPSIGELYYQSEAHHARTSKFLTISEALHVLAETNRTYKGRAANGGDELNLVRVTSIPSEPRIVRRVLKDCEGCNADEVVKFAIWVVGLPHCNLAHCDLYDTCEGALKGIAHRKIYHPHENSIPIRIGLTTIAGTETLTETEVA